MNLPTPWLQWILMVLAAYGALAVLWQVSHVLGSWRRRARGSPALSLLVLARNREDQIEGVVRSVVALARNHRVLQHCDVVVVDYHSTDQTPQIAERLARHFHCLRVIRMSDRNYPGQAPCAVGMFACQSRAVVVLDLIGAAEARPLLQTVSLLLTGRLS